MEISLVHPPGAKKNATTRFFGEKNGLWLGTITRSFSPKEKKRAINPFLMCFEHASRSGVD